MATSGGALHTPPSGPPPSNPQSAPNLVSFDPKAVVPSQPIYLQRNDQIALFLFSSAVSPIVRINYRWLTPGGEIKEGEFDTPPIVNNTFLTFPLYEGWLLSFGARVTSGFAIGSFVFMQVFVTRTNIQNIHALIWQGYIPNVTSTGWPGTPSKEITDGAGVIRSIIGTTPPAGADILESVPGQRRWTLITLNAVLTASATVANRSVLLVLDDGANLYYSSPSFLNQTAGQVQRYVLGQQPTTVAPVAGAIVLSVPVPISLKIGFRIKTVTAGIQAGDQWSAPVYTVQEWGLWDQ